MSAGLGTKGERLHDWAYLELAELEADEFCPEAKGLWTRGLLIRRHIANGEMTYFTVWCPAGTPIETLVAVEGHRWAIEDGFETAKNELGLTHHETRSWHGWHRHVSLVMLAFAMMAVIRYHANQPTPKNLHRQNLLSGFLFECGEACVWITANAGAQGAGMAPLIQALSDLVPAFVADAAEIARGRWVQPRRGGGDQPHLTAQHGSGRGGPAAGGAPLVLTLGAEQLLEVVVCKRQAGHGVAVEQARSVAAGDLGKWSIAGARLPARSRCRRIAVSRPSKRRRTVAALPPSGLPSSLAAVCTQA